MSVKEKKARKLAENIVKANPNGHTVATIGRMPSIKLYAFLADHGFEWDKNKGKWVMR